MEINVGTILSGAFSYSARIPYFCRVIRKTEKSVWLEELQTYNISDDGYGQNGQKMPDLVAPGTPKKKGYRINFFKNGTAYIKYGTNTILNVWNGQPEDFYTD